MIKESQELQKVVASEKNLEDKDMEKIYASARVLRVGNSRDNTGSIKKTSEKV